MSQEIDKEMIAIQKETGNIVQRAENFQIVSEKHFEDAGAVCSWIFKMKKKIEEKRKFFVQPLNEQVKKINEMFKGYSQPLDEADRIIRAKMLDFRRKQEEKIKKEAERLAKENKMKGEAKKEFIEEVMASTEVAKQTENTTIKKVWTFEILDEAKVPRQFLIVSETKIREAIRNGVREIPGIRIFEEERISMK